MDLQFTSLATWEDCGFTIYLTNYLRRLWNYNLPGSLPEKMVGLQFTWRTMSRFTRWAGAHPGELSGKPADLQFTCGTLLLTWFTIGVSLEFQPQWNIFHQVNCKSTVISSKLKLRRLWQIVDPPLYKVYGDISMITHKFWPPKAEKWCFWR